MQRLAAACLGMAILACTRAPSLTWVNAVEEDATRLEFSGGFIGLTDTSRLALRNDGEGEATLSLRNLEGDVGLLSSASFQLSLEPPDAVLAPGAQAEVVVVFRPRARAAADGGELAAYAGRVEVVDPRYEERPLGLELTGLAIPTDCELPASIDFGAMQRGAFVERSLVFRNPSPLPQRVEWGTPLSDLGIFGWTEGAGTAVLAPGTSRTLNMTFSASALGRYSGTVRARAGEGCRPRDITLLGTVVDTFLALDPPVVDCGFTSLATGKTVRGRIHNTTALPVSILRQSFASPGFGLGFSSSAGFTIPPAGSTEFEVECRPPEAGVLTGELKLETSLGVQSELTVRARAVGGVPRVVPAATTLLFDEPTEVKLVDGLAPSVEVQSLVLSHGEQDVLSVVPELEVRLGRFTDAGVRLPGPGIEVLPGEGADAGDFQLVVPPDGLPGSISAGNSAIVQVRATATSPGLRRATLVVHTDAAASRRLEVSLFSEARQYSPCRLTGPAVLNMGVLARGQSLTRDNPLRNAGVDAGDVCFIGRLPVGPETFRLVGSVTRVLPGERVPLPVAFSTAFAVEDTEQRSVLRLPVSSASRPTADLEVRGTVGQPCLALEPRAERLPTPGGCDWRGQVSLTNECDVDLPFGPWRLEPFCDDDTTCGPFRLLPPTPHDGGLLRAGERLTVGLDYRGLPGQTTHVITTLGDGGVRGLALTSRDSSRLDAPLNLGRERHALLVVSRSLNAQPESVYRAAAAALAQAADAGVPFRAAVVRGEWDFGTSESGVVPAPGPREPLGVYVIPPGQLGRTVNMAEPESEELLLARLREASLLGGPGSNSTDVCLEAARQVARQRLNGPPIAFDVLLCFTGDGDASTPRRGQYDSPDGGIDRHYYLERLEKLSVSAVVGTCAHDAGTGGLGLVTSARRGKLLSGCQDESALSAQLRDLLLEWRRRVPLEGHGPSTSSLVRVHENLQLSDGGLERRAVNGWTYLPSLHAIELPTLPSDAGALTASHSLLCPP